MRVETCTFSARAGSIDRTLLEWVAAASGRTSGISIAAADGSAAAASSSSSVVETDARDDQTYASLTTQNTFAGTTQSRFARGLVGCVRLLAAPELLLTGQPAAVVESWLQITEATVLPLLRAGATTKGEVIYLHASAKAILFWLFYFLIYRFVF